MTNEKSECIYCWMSTDMCACSLVIPYCFLEMIALSVKRLSHTLTIAFLTFVISESGTLRMESKSPAPAIFFRSSKVELDLTATRAL
jgi:hypothetical protein